MTPDSKNGTPQRVAAVAPLFGAALRCAVRGEIDLDSRDGARILEYSRSQPGKPGWQLVAEILAQSSGEIMLKAEMLDYLCWLEDFCQFRKAALDGKANDYLVLASDGTTCWGKTYAEAVRVAMEHDKEIFDATQASPNIPVSRAHTNTEKLSDHE